MEINSCFLKKYYIYILMLIFSITPTSLYSTNPISQKSYNEISLTKDESALNFWSKTKQFIAKKWYKIGAKISIEQVSSIALIVGATSLVLLFVSILIGVPSLILLAFALALTGDILSIRALRKTKNTKSDFRKVRTKAWFGLILSLLTGLLPLALLGVIIAVISAG